jgi:hypothetical protein
VSLKDFASKSRFVNWNESDIYNIALNISYEEFLDLKPITSDKFDSEQFEIPVVVISGKDISKSILATKSKLLLNELISFWDSDPDLIVRIHKKGTGFYTKYTLEPSTKVYDKASGKIKNKGAK